MQLKHDLMQLKQQCQILACLIYSGACQAWPLTTWPVDIYSQLDTNYNDMIFFIIETQICVPSPESVPGMIVITRQTLLK